MKYLERLRRDEGKKPREEGAMHPQRLPTLTRRDHEIVKRIVDEELRSRALCTVVRAACLSRLTVVASVVERKIHWNAIMYVTAYTSVTLGTQGVIEKL